MTTPALSTPQTRVAPCDHCNGALPAVALVSWAPAHFFSYRCEEGIAVVLAHYPNATVERLGRSLPSRKPLVCGDQECDFSTFDSDAWGLHEMNTGHALHDEDAEGPEPDTNADNAPGDARYRASMIDAGRGHLLP